MWMCDYRQRRKKTFYIFGTRVKYEQVKLEFLNYSYFCLKFFSAVNWIPIVNIFLNLKLIHSQIFRIFATTNFPRTPMRCHMRGIFGFWRQFEKVGCLFASYHCHLICTHEMKTSPKSKILAGFSFGDVNFKLIIQLSVLASIWCTFDWPSSCEEWCGKAREACVCSWNLAQVGQHQDQHQHHKRGQPLTWPSFFSSKWKQTWS